jgi:probable HAF family extracellular repeat protein
MKQFATFRSRFYFFSGLLLVVSVGEAAQPRYTSFDYPGATSTTPQGINSAGDVVGFYVDTKNATHGFLLSSGTFTSIDYPGAIATQARAINANGDIVGTHVDAAGLPGGGLRGFLLEGKEFTEIMYPGHMNTILQRITDEGVILGCYHDQDTMGTMHGITYQIQDPGSFAELPTQASMNNGALVRGEVVAGLYTDMMTNVNHSYLASKDLFAPFDFPFSIGTSAWDMSSQGEVAGVYTDSAKKVHGFVLTLDSSVLTFGIDPQFGVNGSFSFTSVDFPGATATNVRGINTDGTVVGFYVDAAGKTHGFLLTRPASDDE